MKSIHLCLFVLLLAGNSAFSQKKTPLYKVYYDSATFYELNDIDKAIFFAEKAKVEIEKIKGKKDTLYINMLSTLGVSYTSLAEYAKAKTYFAEEVQLRKEVQEPSHPYYNAAISNLIGINIELGEYDEAEAMALTLPEQDKKIFGELSYEYANSLSNLGILYMDMGNYKKAEPILMQSLQTVKKLGKSEKEEKDEYYYIMLAAYTSNLGTLYDYLGDFSESEYYYLSAVEIYNTNFQEPIVDYSNTLSNLAWLYYNMGKFAEAESSFKTAIKILDGQTEDFSANKAVIQMNMAVLYHKMGQYAEAESLFAKALENDKAELGEDNILYANTLNSAAAFYSDMGRFDEAEKLYLQALKIRKTEIGETSPIYAESLNNLAFLYKDSKNYPESEKLFRQALEIRKNELGEKHPEYARTLYNLGALLLKMDKVQEAEKLIGQSLDIRNRILNTQHPEIAKNYSRLAIINWQTNKSDKAAQYYEQTFKNYFNQIDNNFPFLSEAEKTRFYNNLIKPGFEEFNSFAVTQKDINPSLIGAMYDYQLSTKAMLLYATNKVRQRILGSNDTLLIKKYQTWIDQKEKLSKFSAMAKEEVEKQKINLDSLSIATNTLEKELSAQSEIFGKTFEKKKPTWKDVQKKLAKNEAAVEIIRFRKFLPEQGGTFSSQVNYAALIVTPQTKNNPALVLLENGIDLENKYLNQYRNAIKFQIEESFSYNNYYKPIVEYLKGYKKIYFSPDGVYNQININTVRNPKTNTYLIDDFEIRLVTNSKDVIAFSKERVLAPASERKAELFGFPNYNKGMNKDQLLAKRSAAAANADATPKMERSLRGSLQRYISGNNLLAELPGTKVEIENITAVYQKGSVKFQTYLSDNAIEESIKQIQSPHTLHIATHGFFLDDNVPAKDRESNNFSANPLLKSGLILAGVNHSLNNESDDPLKKSEDGILTAYEAMNLNLDKTDLVVLSACETGLGVVNNGEGVYGLQRAFQIAGAKTVVMSLWQVNDDATQELMSLFYNQMLESGNKQVAFRNAQLKLKEKYKAPFYWGAFVMIGE